MNKKITNYAGFTLIELVLVMGIMGVLSLGLAAYMVQQVQSQRQTEFKRQGEDISNTALRAATKQESMMATEALEGQPLGGAVTPAPDYWWDNQYSRP